MKTISWFVSLFACGAFTVCAQNLAPAVTNASVTVTNQDDAETNAPSAAELAQLKYERETIAQLTTLQANDDAASLAAILAELKNTNSTIRAAAVQAVVQFNDRSAIPVLQKMADATTDTAEKKEIRKAIAYMKLPSLTEYLDQRRALEASRAATNAPAATSTTNTSAVLVSSNAPAATITTNAPAHP